MQYFRHLSPEMMKQIFFISPQIISKRNNKEIDAYALGATLYMPSIRKDIGENIIHQKYSNLTSVILCLEDSLGDLQVEEAEKRLLLHLEKILKALEDNLICADHLPYIFIRIRSVEQFQKLKNKFIKYTKILSGFAFPKFSNINGELYLKLLKEMNQQSEHIIYGMPILETPCIMYKETRIESLVHIASILDEYKNLILNIRIGATDFTALFGIRRSHHFTIYDIQVMRDCICDIVNTFVRVGKDYVVSGPVWEFFSSHEQMQKTQIHEILQDKQNGIVGKTVIHPSHIKLIQAHYTVTHEEYMDAINILSVPNHSLGVIKSLYGNKMNEIKPHTHWAKKIILKSHVYGVLNEGYEFVNLL